MLTFGKEGLQRAQQHLEEALAITGESALLFGQLAQVYCQYWNMGIRLEEEDLRQAREYADRALELDPKSPDHLLIRGLLEVTGGSALRALTFLQAALDIDPDFPDALGWYSATAGFIGLEDQANAKLKRLRMIDPLNPFNSGMPIFIHLLRGRFPEALELAESTRLLRPPEMLVDTGYAYALALAGRPQEAVSILRDTYRQEDGYWAREMLALACAFVEDRRGALSLIDEDFERWARKDFSYSAILADILARIGEGERAINWLEIAVTRGNINYPYFSQYHPFLSKLHGNARFDTLMQKAQEEWEKHVS
jgi:predicted Zn-dependent protease